MRLRDFLKLHPMFPVVILFSLSVSVTSFYLNQYIIAYAELVLGLLLAVLVYFAEKRNFNDLKKTVEILNSHIVSNDEDRVSSIPLPFVVCDKDGGIVWYNNLFELELLGEKGLTNKQIKNFIPQEKIESSLNKGSFNATYNGKRYTVYLSELVDTSSEKYVFYFIDDTYYKNIVEKYDETRPVIMIVSVDGMDDVSSKISQNAFSSLLSDAEGMIISWFTHYMCILRKTGDGRFFVVVEHSVFEQMKKAGFDILDTIRDYRLEGISTGLTLSVGIATGNELSACESAARKSLDMARGRGGDQVVINDNDNYEFFGGIATGVESRNQVQSRIVAGSIEELIKHSSNVLIMGHKNVDLDALGSSIGISEAVQQLGIDVKIVIDEKNTMAKPLLDYYKDTGNASVFVSVNKALSELEDETLVIITDVMRSGFTDCPELAEKAVKKVVIDHHRMSVDYISDALILYHEPNSSSASEMVTELIRYMPSKPMLSKEASEALLSGIYLDTKNFTLKTGVRTFEAAAYLRDNGADTITVRKLFAATVEENAIISQIVNNAQIKGNFAFAKTENKDPSIRLAAAKAADDLLNIEDVDASFVVFATGDNAVSISARSYGRVNVQIIMEKLGGGGHHTMAAAQLKDTSVDNANEMLQEIVEEFAKKNQLRNNKKED
ncbi:MAG: DHH family phosphoesterase [Clostridia bacterium]|nr:DHH family phosphoesterase [Clostridia bacterium]